MRLLHLLLLCSVLSLAGTSSCQRPAKPGQSAASLPAQKPVTMNQEIISHEGMPIMVGPINRQGLLGDNYQQWFTPNYDAYKVDTTTLLPYKKTIKGLDMLVFMGTWCEDSQGQVPQFYRILDWVGYPEKNLRVVSLDNHPDRYKKAPNGEEAGWMIESVPTFIFLKDGREIGRIVEYPSASLEKDMAYMLAALGRE